jgi:sec-independent protein translocase protein TatC
MTMFLAFGITFEVPVAVILLVRMRIVTIAQLQQSRGYVIVGAFIIAAVVTPPDVVSQFLLAVPLCILYEVGILLARGIKPSSEEIKTDGQDSTS